MALEPRQKLFQCGGTGGCQMMSPIDWPDETDAIWSELTKRPVPVTRNWYPEDHPIAINAGIPHGQSVSDLAIETAKHMGE